jgi:sortase A
MAIGRCLPAVIEGRRVRRIHLVRVASLACLLIGLGLVGTFAYQTWNGYKDQQQLNQQWNQEVGASTVPLTPPARIDGTLHHPVKGIDFAIRIPKLRYFAAVREGVTPTALYSGPSHYPGTVWPGDQGTVGVAAHNMYWINFPQLKAHDEIDIETRYGKFRYWVTGSKIVNFDDRTVVVPKAPGYHLVLTTCWPLWEMGFATQRYVIFAAQFSPQLPKPSTQLS